MLTIRRLGELSNWKLKLELAVGGNFTRKSQCEERGVKLFRTYRHSA